MKLKLNVNSKMMSSQEMIDKSKKVLWLSMNKMELLSKRFVPVDTGRLKNSIILSPSSSGATEYKLADGVDYGICVEYGTIKMKAQPFFRPALDEVRNIWMPMFWSKTFAKT